MPDLFYGPYRHKLKRRLYTPGMRLVKSKVFDGFKLRRLAPTSRQLHVANIWHWRKKKHTLIAWHTDSGKECLVIIPALLNQREAVEYARTVFPEIMPPALTFRFFQDYYEVLLYD